MRSQDFSRRLIRRRIGAMTAVALCLFTGGVTLAQVVPSLTGNQDPMQSQDAKPLPKWVVDDLRKKKS